MKKLVSLCKTRFRSDPRGAISGEDFRKLPITSHEPVPVA
jgi:hypothetical protein